MHICHVNSYSRNRNKVSNISRKQLTVGYPIVNNIQSGFPISSVLPNNPFISAYGSVEILVHAPNHQIKNTASTVTFEGLDNDFNYNSLGIYKSYIEYDSMVGGPTFPIIEIVFKDTFDLDSNGNKIFHSDYFKISLSMFN